MEQSDNSELTNKARDALTCGPTAFEAAQLIKPPVSRVVSDYIIRPAHRPSLDGIGKHYAATLPENDNSGAMQDVSRSTKWCVR